jgi:hypothetical protein
MPTQSASRKTSALSTTPTSGAAKASATASTQASPIDPDISTILATLQSNNANDSADEARPSKKSRHIILTLDQFNMLLQTATRHDVALSRSPGTSPTSIVTNATTQLSLPAYYSNARYEEISTKGIKPLYDGSKDKLIPFLTKLDLRRQHEGWSPATYVTVAHKKYDLTTHFALLTETDMKTATLGRWTSSNIDQDKHTVGHATYNSRLLGMVIMNSITDDFMTTLVHKVPMELRNDGTFLLWAVSHNIHHNNIAFHEHIRNKIRTSTLAQHNNDVNTYIIGLRVES